MDISNIYVHAIAEPTYLRSPLPSRHQPNSSSRSAGRGRLEGDGAYSWKSGWGWEKRAEGHKITLGVELENGDVEYVYESPML